MLEISKAMANHELGAELKSLSDDKGKTGIQVGIPASYDYVNMTTILNFQVDKSPLEIRNFRDSWRIITSEELAQHTSVENKDAWMCVKGVVYDVSTYAAKHPGGAEKIQKYAGKDATDVFNIVHSYVNVDNILHDHQLGVLKGHPDAPKRPILAKVSGKCCCIGEGRHPHAPITYFKQDSIVGTYVIEFQGASEEADWTIGINKKQFLQVFKRIDKRKVWYSSYKLPEPLFNDILNLEFRRNFQFVLISVRMPLPATVWIKQSNALRENGQFFSLNDELTTFNAHLYSKKCLTHNVLLFSVTVCQSARINVPLGYHVRLHVGDISRPYTPVCANLVMSDINKKQNKKKHFQLHEVTTLYFIIKIYPRGALGKALDKVEIDDGTEIPTIQVSTPYGSFDSDFLHDFGTLLLFGAGTGITPMIQIIHRLLVDKPKKQQVVALIVFVEKDFDLIWRNQLVELNNTINWFYYFPVLTKPGPHWSGLTGRITDDLVAKCLSKMHEKKMSLRKACVCGPPGFNAEATKSLAGTVQVENMFVFTN